MFRAGVERVSVKATMSMAAVRSMFVLLMEAPHVFRACAERDSVMMKASTVIGKSTSDSCGLESLTIVKSSQVKSSQVKSSQVKSSILLLYSCTVLCTVPGTRYSLSPFKVADFSYYPVRVLVRAQSRDSRNYVTLASLQSVLHPICIGKAHRGELGTSTGESRGAASAEHAANRQGHCRSCL